MALPLTKAQQIWNEAASRLTDDGEAIDPFTLRRWLRDANLALPNAPNDAEQGVLWWIIGQTHQRFAFALRDPSHLVLARDALLRTVALRPDDADALVTLGSVLGFLKDLPNALACFRKAEIQFPEGSTGRAIAVLNQAAAHWELGEPGPANALLRRAAGFVRSDDAHALLRLAHVTALVGHEDDAVEVLAQYVAARLGFDRGDDEALEVIARAPEAVEHPLRSESLSRALHNVIKRYEEPVPDDMATPALRTLSSQGWEAFMKLVEA